MESSSIISKNLNTLWDSQLNLEEYYEMLDKLTAYYERNHLEFVEKINNTAPESFYFESPLAIEFYRRIFKRLRPEDVNVKILNVFYAFLIAQSLICQVSARESIDSFPYDLHPKFKEFHLKMLFGDQNLHTSSLMAPFDRLLLSQKKESRYKKTFWEKQNPTSNKLVKTCLIPNEEYIHPFFNDFFSTYFSSSQDVSEMANRATQELLKMQSIENSFKIIKDTKCLHSSTKKLTLMHLATNYFRMSGDLKKSVEILTFIKDSMNL